MAAVDHLAGYDAFVVGSAVYAAHWQKEAAAFVQRNRTVLATRPVWLFSSGPLGTVATDAKGRDLTVAAEPKEIAEFEGAIGPRAIASSSEPWTRASSGSRNGRSGSCQPPARCSPRVTSATGPRSTPGHATSPTNWRSEKETPIRTTGRSGRGARSDPRNTPRSCGTTPVFRIFRTMQGVPAAT